MEKLSVILTNETGLHARPASILIKKIQGFNSRVIIKKDENEYNAKSMMSLLSMEALKGSKLNFYIDGDDEIECKIAIQDLVNKGFEN